MMIASALAILCSAISVIPPLSAEQKAKVAAVSDQSADVDDGFYTLLENAAQWPTNEKPAGVGLSVPAVEAAPGDFRGLPMLIEGEYLGLREVYMVKRSGPWDGKLEQWGIRIPEAQTNVMVFLVNPPPVPVQGQKVSVVARFYKSWPVKDERTGREVRYLVFVGRSAKVHAGAALPPLTESQRRQLEAATDFTDEIDRGPIYPLLHNAAEARGLPMPAAPLITASDPIIGAPSEYRGLPLRVEGRLIERREFPSSRGGDWKALEQWGIEIAPKTADRPGDTVIVYMVDPPADLKAGDSVSIVGRFYKIWRTYQAKGELNEPFNFVVMVSGSAVPLDAASVGAGGAAVRESSGPSGQILRTALGAGLLLAFGFFMVRRYSKRVGVAGGGGGSPTGLRELLEKRRQEREDAEHSAVSDNGDGDLEPQGPPLPPDPAEALLEMERRRLGNE